jgi:hypothetical protein
MSYFNRSDAGDQANEQPRESTRSTIADLGGRVARWFAGLDEEPETFGAPARDPVGALEAGPAPEDEPSRFPLTPFGYSQAAVDEHVGELERELDELRNRQAPPISITEEIERIGEQTSSILVVAHDKAHETTRLAQEQADRCIEDAASNAVAITEQATARLRELDNETDQVWRERERLLEDVRVVSNSLACLADQAAERFPAAEPRASDTQATLS